MRKFGSSLLKAVLLIAIASLGLLEAQTVTPQSVKIPVVVTNTTAQPVPTAAQGTTTVAGSVNVVNTPTVSVGNTPSVSVANTPSVNVSSMPSVSVGSMPGVNITSVDPSVTVNAVNATARNIVRLAGGATLNDGNPYGGGNLQSINGNGTYYVPAGKRLVITGMTVQFGAPAGQECYAQLLTAWSDTSNYQMLNAPLQRARTFEGFDTLVLNVTGNFYADQNTYLTFGFSRGDNSSGRAGGGISVWGYLVDCGTGGCTQ